MLIPWNVDPSIFTIGSFSLRWYSLLFLLSFVFSYQIMKKEFKGNSNSEMQVDSLLTFMMISTLVGARLGHVVFYEPEIFLTSPLRVFKVWEGGLASHGAAIAIPLGAFLYTLKHKSIGYLLLMDRVATCVAMCGGLIRLGNLMNSEIIGQPTDGTWGVIFKRVDDIPRHPSQIYESVYYFIVFGILYGLLQRSKLPTSQHANGTLFGLFFVLTFGFRFFIERIKEVQVTKETGMVLNIGQQLSIPLIVIGLLLMIVPRLMTKKSAVL